MKKSAQNLCALGLSAALPAALAWYYDTYIHWQPQLYPITVVTITLCYIAFTLFTLWARGERKASALAWKTALSTVLLTGIALIGISAIINNVMHGGRQPGPRLAASVALPLAGAQILMLFILLLRALRRPVLGALMSIVMLATALLGFGGPYLMREYRKNITAPPPPGLREGQFWPRGPWGDMADFTVSPDGMSIEEARDLIREARENGDDRHLCVEILPGEYNIKQIVFDERDYDTTYSTRNDGNEAILNGGMRLESGDFAPVSGEAAGRLSGEARAHVVQIDLAQLGLTAEDWGKMYSFGAYHTGAKYDDGAGPLPCELFFNGKRCVTARWPNGDEWLKSGKVLDNGDSSETYESGTVRHAGWDELRNPRGGTFVMDKETAARAANWATLDDVWMFGCFKWDWADMSTPVRAIDNSAGTVTTQYASNYGFKEGGTYYFYNVLEELDAPGEWYLDRENGLLYLWPPEDIDDARIDLSLSTETLIQGEGLKNITFTGLTLQGTRGDGMRLQGDGITVDHCVVRAIAGSAITLDGYGNTVSNCEIYRVGKQGITISGGDAETLTPGNSRAVNNLVYDWPEVVMTYQGGVNVYGTGNLAAHNELHNSPHSAMFFGGNNNVIEYNLIRDVCLITDDAGAIYNGRSWWSAYGTVIRYNALIDIGSGDHTPDGIYMDDALSGVTIHDNLLVNVPGLAIHLGGGRDLNAHGNVLVNCGTPISYDDRARQGALFGGWYEHHSKENGPQWQDLWDSPWQTALWKETYPRLAAISSDFSDPDSPGFGVNPADSLVIDNVVVGGGKLRISDAAQRFSTVEPNKIYSAGRVKDYWELPGYENIPMEKIGRTPDPGV